MRVLTLLFLAACVPHKPPTPAAEAPPEPVGVDQSTHLLPLEAWLVQSGDGPMVLVTTETEAGRQLLATPSIPIDPADPYLELLLSRMRATLDLAEGVGLAAPQVGVLRRVILVQRLDLEDEPVLHYLNPALTWTSEETVEGWEGCLSVLDERAQVERPQAIRVEHVTGDGEHHEEAVEGWTARIFQHEIDHLDGVLFTEKQISAASLTAAEYRAMRAAWDALEDEAEHADGPPAGPPPTEHPDSPFSAEQIRDATLPGRRYTWRVQADSQTTAIRALEFEAVDPEGAVLHSVEVDLDGEISQANTERVTTWSELESHAHFPVEHTAVSEAWVDVPAGAFDALVYTVSDEAGGATTFWFARDLPGAPVRVETAGVEEAVTSMELVDHTPGE
jgi:peptide deformylase